jgi:uncharacterized phage infection (PIP) family protein YhgE
LFVVLLVILSLLTTAATVVFVSQTENWKADFDAQTKQLNAARADLAEAQQQAASASAQVQEASRSSQQQVEQMRQAQNQLQTRMNELSAQLADKTSQLALQSADLTRVTEALKSSQDATNKQSDQIASLRQTNDERMRQNVELNTAVTDLTDKFQVTERERRYLAEQVAALKGQADKLGKALQEAGINPKFASSSAGAPAINGVIRARKNIAGVEYASISVGANDGVTKGMEFKIVDRNAGNFLGILTVDSVEPTAATARITRPRIKDVKPGIEVRTQL